jgi:hypothetical protein
MAYSIYANHPYKICKSCGQERELIMFSKKSKYKYKSSCRLCVNKMSFSVYYYPTAEMQKIAKQNGDRIKKDILLYGGTSKICRGCNKNPVALRNAHCTNVKQEQLNHVNTVLRRTNVNKIMIVYTFVTVMYDT